MAALTTPNTFSAGAKIVATQMNANFSNIVTWVAQTPTFSVSGSLTTIAGTLQVTEASTFQAAATFQGASPMEFTGATTGNGHTTTFAITDPSSDKTITFPDATGTVALTTTAIPTSIIDAKGDLIAGTAADTAGRLAVGTNNYVLTADSGESTGLKWAATADPTWENANNVLTNSVFN
jgi:hypothetical protein|tara:strand:- start:128 stop:664 length:537 start_codon:yes stop_codon:yes gene_type:complete